MGLLGQRPLAPDPVDRAIPRGGHKPADGVAGDPIARPALGGDRECLGGGFLGAVEVAEEANQRGQHAPPLLAEALLDQLGCSTSGRTSTLPPSRADGIRAASSSASSISATSNT